MRDNLLTTSPLGLEPETKIEPSGRRVAVEWYSRGMVDGERPALENLEPFGASGSYIKGCRMGSVA